MKYIFYTVCSAALFFSSCKKTTETPDNQGGGTGGGDTKGQVVFWTATDLGCGNITVNCGGSSAQVKGYYSSAPACGASNAATFSLDAGTYNFTASCTGLTWSGTITIVAGVCSKLQFTGSGSGGGGGGGSTGTCTGSIKNLGTITSVGYTGANWSSWLKIADVGNGSVYVSYKVSNCGTYGLIGYSYYKIMNTCTSLPNCYFSYRYEYQSCDGSISSEGVYSLKLNQSSYESLGQWFLGYKVTKSFVSGTVSVD